MKGDDWWINVHQRTSGCRPRAKVACISAKIIHLVKQKRGFSRKLTQILRRKKTAWVPGRAVLQENLKTLVLKLAPQVAWSQWNDLSLLTKPTWQFSSKEIHWHILLWAMWCRKTTHSITKFFSFYQMAFPFAVAQALVFSECSFHVTKKMCADDARN